MEDKEKVIEQCKQAIDSGEPVMDYNFYYHIIKLLKEQKAVEPKHNPLSPTDWFCGKCGMSISRFHNYCPSCGQAVKWE